MRRLIIVPILALLVGCVGVGANDVLSTNTTLGQHRSPLFPNVPATNPDPANNLKLPDIDALEDFSQLNAHDTDIVNHGINTSRVDEATSVEQSASDKANNGFELK